MYTRLIRTDLAVSKAISLQYKNAKRETCIVLLILFNCSCLWIVRIAIIQGGWWKLDVSNSSCLQFWFHVQCFSNFWEYNLNSQHVLNENKCVLLWYQHIIILWMCFAFHSHISVIRRHKNYFNAVWINNPK